METIVILARTIRKGKEDDEKNQGAKE